MVNVYEYLVVTCELDKVRVVKCDSLDEGKDILYWKYMNMLDNMEYKLRKHKVITSSDKAEWNSMIKNFICHICCYNSENADYMTCFKLSDKELEEIGWKEFEER